MRTIKQVHQSDRYILISTKLGPPVEMARWLMERHGTEYDEDVHAPGFHVITTTLKRLPQELPVVIAPDKWPWCGIKGFLSELDRLLLHEGKLFGESEPERQAAWDMIDLLHRDLFWRAVQIYYYFALPLKKVVVGPAIQEAPTWEKLFVRFLFPIWKKVMRRGLDLDTFDIDAATVLVDRTFAKIENTLADQPFLSGQEPGTLDIVFAALASPLIMPPQFGATLPTLTDLPEDFQVLVTDYRERPAGQLVLSTYTQIRRS